MIIRVKEKSVCDSCSKNRGRIKSAVRVFPPLWQVLRRPIEYSIQLHRVLCRPSRCLRKLRKYPVGRESISAVVASTLSPVGVLHPIASGILSAVSVFHPEASSTLSPVGVLHPIAANILSAVVMLAQKEEVPCRPSECFLDLKK